jgi:hypothetical protein
MRPRHRPGVAAAGAVLAVVLLLAGAPGAGAQTFPDTPQQLYEGSRASIDPALRARSCAELRGGTAGSREPAGFPPAPDRGNGLAAGDRTAAPRGLPDVVPFKTRSETFNRRFVFVVRGGLVWFRSNAERTGIRQPWRELPAPPCFYGRVRQIAVDDDELLAIGPERRIYTMDHALGDPAEFNWTSRWGPLFWTGSGHRLPGRLVDWAWSVISQREDGHWPDRAGNRHRVGDFKVSHVWMLREGGRRLSFNDPWLARDTSYEMCGPHRGRLRAVDLAASGSTVFVIGRRGDLFTRLYDFDISGSDPVFFRYSYADRRGRANPAIQLPPPAWVEQPKVPGRITGLISIEKRGRGAVHRTLRVEGLDRRGRTGYWQKDLGARRSRAWRFHRTGRRLLGRRLPNPRRDTSVRGLAPSEDRRYVLGGRLLRRPRPFPAGRWAAELLAYNVACSPTRLRVHLSPRLHFDLLLHTRDGIRLEPRAQGLSGEPRSQYGTVEVPGRVRRTGNRAVRSWVRRHVGTARFRAVDVQATAGRLVLEQLGWRLRHAGSTDRRPPVAQIHPSTGPKTTIAATSKEANAPTKRAR